MVFVSISQQEARDYIFAIIIHILFVIIYISDKYFRKYRSKETWNKPPFNAVFG